MARARRSQAVPIARPARAAACDYLAVGGATSTVTVLEASPSDEHKPGARDIRRWAQMLESEYDFDYRSVPPSLECAVATPILDGLIP